MKSQNLAAILLLVISASCFADVSHCVKRAQEVTWAGRSLAGEQKLPAKSALKVSTSDALLAALEGASDGTAIQLANGSYDVGYTEVNARITLFAETQFGALITGSSVLALKGAGSIIANLDFSHGGPTSKRHPARHSSLNIRAANVKILNNRFTSVGVNSDVPDRSGITIAIDHSDNTLIEGNLFRNNQGLAVKTDDFSLQTKIFKNDFIESYNFSGAGEVAHLGNSLNLGQNQSVNPDSQKAIFERNFVCEWSLERELISIKSNENIIRNNYFENNLNSAIVVRMGSYNLISSNTMIGNLEFPVRISGE